MNTLKIKTKPKVTWVTCGYLGQPYKSQALPGCRKQVAATNPPQKTLNLQGLVGACQLVAWGSHRHQTVVAWDDQGPVCGGPRR